jgi:hypothetical protein
MKADARVCACCRQLDNTSAPDSWLRGRVGLEIGGSQPAIVRPKNGTVKFAETGVPPECARFKAIPPKAASSHARRASGSFAAEGGEGIDCGGAPRGQPTGDARGSDE